MLNTILAVAALAVAMGTGPVNPNDSKTPDRDPEFHSPFSALDVGCQECEKVDADKVLFPSLASKEKQDEKTHCPPSVTDGIDNGVENTGMAPAFAVVDGDPTPCWDRPEGCGPTIEEV